MKTLLLTAKWIAVEESSSTIRIQHFYRALLSLTISDSNAKHKIDAFLSDKGHDVSGLSPIGLGSLDLDQVAALPRVSYSDDLYDLVTHMDSEGFGLVASISDVPRTKESAGEQRKNALMQVSETRALLQSKLFGQDDAIEVVSDAVMKMTWQKKANRPREIFFFLGPPATGKTYLAQLLGKGLQGYAFKSFDMSQYDSENESFGLVGLRKGYENAGKGGLTSFVKDNPKSIIVFDEIEKAHSRIQMSLLRIFSEGVIEDQFTNEEVDFTETLIVFTSNLGSEVYSNPRFAESVKTDPKKARETLLELIRREQKIENGHAITAIKPEMLSRISQGQIVLFNKLTVTDLARIAQQQIHSDFDSFTHSMGLEIEFESISRLSQWAALSFAPSFDIRALKARLVDLLLDPITDYLLAHSEHSISGIRIQFQPDLIGFLEDADIEALANQMVHKYQHLMTKRSFLLEHGQLVMTLGNPEIEKLSREDDFSGSANVQVDLPEVNFSDIAGHNQIKMRLNEVIAQFQQKEKLQELGINLPKGMLLYGPPGTGKTLLAKAFSSEAELPFIACSGHDLLDEDFIKTLFSRAREYAPALIFIDEIDALPKRGSAGAYADALVNRLLVEMDGFVGGDDIFVIAATNRKENIDGALLRSGRIDLHFEVPQLDADARRWFIEKFFTGEPFAPELNVERLVTFSAGLSGADMRKIHRESVLAAMRDSLAKIEESMVLEQINTLKYGEPLDLEESDLRLRETAFHEAGHAVASMVLLPHRKIEQLTVVARGSSLGMLSYDNEQTHDYTKDFLFKMTCVVLAGRAIQVKEFGDIGLDSGASSDLSQAMNFAYAAIARWGMSESLYNVSVDALSEVLKTDAYKDTLEQEIQNWMQRATEATDALIDTHYESIKNIAHAVLEKESLDEKTLKQLLTTD